MSSPLRCRHLPSSSIDLTPRHRRRSHRHGRGEYERDRDPLVGSQRDAYRLSPCDVVGIDLDADSRGFYADQPQLLLHVRAELRPVSAELAGVPRSLQGHAVLGEPSLRKPAELEDREKQWDEDDDHERRLERGHPLLLAPPAGHRTVCSCVTSVWRRAARPLFHADTPMTRVPRMTAAPITYSIVARP